MLFEIQYFDNGNLACYNGYSFRRDKQTGYYLSSVKIGNKRMRLHVYVWETENGKKAPKGYDVHHIDEDKSNNDISNLVLLSRKEHRATHCETMTDEQIERRRRNVIENATPAAVAWHKSQVGKEWHIQNGKKVFSKFEPVEYICTYCGKRFMSKHRYGENQNTFCSNNCKSAFRRYSGVDDIEARCDYCGRKFVKSKYSKAKYCKLHRNKGSRN